MGEYTERIRNSALRKKIAEPESLARTIMKGARTIAFGGMGGQSVPKAFPKALSDISDSIRDSPLTIFTGGGATPSFERYISELNIARRYYYLSGDEFRKKVNAGKVQLFDYWVSEYSRIIRDKVITKGKPIDVAVVEITGIDEAGRITPSLSLDTSVAMIEASEKVILEISISKPELRGLHDVYLPQRNRIIPIEEVSDCAGTPFIEIPEGKIAGIIVQDVAEEASGSYSPVGEIDRKLASNVANFLGDEIFSGSSSVNTPLQLGAGPLASAIIGSLDATGMRIWSEIIPSGWVRNLGESVDFISASSIYNIQGEENNLEEIYEILKSSRGKIVLRPNEITNNLELIARLGVVAVQLAIEIDIFGSANVSHISGNIRNGVGGSGDFTRGAKLTILALPSTASNDAFSRIVPMTTNVDIPKQDIDIVITEQGMADLRGLSPRERAERIISNCSNPKFKDDLFEYFRKACEIGGHVPVHVNGAFDWMRESNKK